jgi:hypothetical protein
LSSQSSKGFVLFAGFSINGAKMGRKTTSEHARKHPEILPSGKVNPHITVMAGAGAGHLSGQHL